jgi:NAD binding domain of 6-phosphogluconate dehydrogenase
MQVGRIDLGRIGANMVRRWIGVGHEVVGYARHAETVRGLVDDRALTAEATSLNNLVAKRRSPRHLAQWCRSHRSTRPCTACPLVDGRRHRHRRWQLLRPRRRLAREGALHGCLTHGTLYAEARTRAAAIADVAA